MVIIRHILRLELYTSATVCGCHINSFRYISDALPSWERELEYQTKSLVDQQVAPCQDHRKLSAEGRDIHVTILLFWTCAVGSELVRKVYSFSSKRSRSCLHAVFEKTRTFVTGQKPITSGFGELIYHCQ